MSSAVVRIVIVVLALFGAAGGGLYWAQRQKPAPQASAPPAGTPAPEAQAPSVQAPQRPTAQTPAVEATAPAMPGASMPAGGTAAAPPAPAPGLPSPGTPSPGMPAAEAVPTPAQGPAFDVVRVEPNGDSVIAGRGVPGGKVELLRNGAVHDTATADASGLFALTPPPLAPGEHNLSLRFTAPDGTVREAPQTVTVVVAQDRTTPPVVALAAPGAPTVIVSAPDAGTRQAPSAAPAAAAPTAAGPRAVAVRAVESEEGGKLFVSGTATPGSSVRLYLNDSYLASAVADAQGAVSFSIQGGIRPGDYRVRLDQLAGPAGQVANRAEVPYQVPATQMAAAPAAVPGASAPPAAMPAIPLPPPAAAPGQAPALSAPAVSAAVPAPASTPSAVVVPEVKTTTVSRGDSLWRISQRVYGQGVRYTVIYGANDGQIRDPDLIYPGQVFVLPSGQDAARARPPG